MLELKNIYKSFAANAPHVLSDISYTLPSGKFFGLLGPSGCGKTTLLRAIAGLDHPSKGDITMDGMAWFRGQDHSCLAPEKRNVGFLFQSYALWPHMSVAENVAFPLKMKKLPVDEIQAQVSKMLSKVGLEGFENRIPSSLSGGQQQRVALARALIQKPKLLLLDEPLSNLDASLRDSMREEIKRLHLEFKMTSIIVTHDWKDAEQLCDQVVVLNQGCIEQSGSPQQIKAAPISDFVKKIVY
jgi:iron(III) transport system ATP-binding protein